MWSKAGHPRRQSLGTPARQSWPEAIRNRPLGDQGLRTRCETHRAEASYSRKPKDTACYASASQRPAPSRRPPIAAVAGRIAGGDPRETNSDLSFPFPGLLESCARQFRHLDTTPPIRWRIAPQGGLSCHIWSLSQPPRDKASPRRLSAIVNCVWCSLSQRQSFLTGKRVCERVSRSADEQSAGTVFRLKARGNRRYEKDYSCCTSLSCVPQRYSCPCSLAHLPWLSPQATPPCAI
jgi:hypothetical protein